MAISLFNKTPKIGDLTSILSNYMTSDEVTLIEKAHQLAEKAHEGQFRQSGESYIHHPLAVALILADLQLDYYCIVAAILHDCIEAVSFTHLRAHET